MQPQGGSSNPFGTIIIFAAIFLIFYFMIVRPQQKKAKERQSLLGSIQKGDKIITIGGMHGTILGVEEKTLLVQATDNVKLKFEKSAIATIIREGETILKEEKK
ncbi:MAG TPA: preprotein translocase subunit YajC [Bacteroidota bacterium]|nr:preprotein translocase subunit YajC [Bacteroidota bacterium]